MADGPAPSSQVIDDTRRWLERAVIGLNLCPFAKAVHVKGQVHLTACDGDEVPAVLETLDGEVTGLLARDATERDTTLLVVPRGFEDFLLFGDLVRQGERLLRQRKLEGVLQLASFHPRFVFAGADEDDVSNFTNRAPWPTLHLLREDSIDRAVAAFPEPDAIYEQNIRTLEQLGLEGWRALGAGRS
jgi:hypothetical protein